MFMKVIRSNLYAALFALFVVGPIVWMLMDRDPPFVLTNGLTVPSEIKLGQVFQIRWTFHNLPRRCPGTVYFYLIDSTDRIWVADPQPAAFGLIDDSEGVGKEGVLISGHKRVMPDDISPGTAKIYLTTDFYCNVTQYMWPLRITNGPIQTKVLP